MAKLCAFCYVRIKIHENKRMTDNHSTVYRQSNQPIHVSRDSASSSSENHHVASVATTDEHDWHLLSELLTGPLDDRLQDLSNETDQIKQTMTSQEPTETRTITCKSPRQVIRVDSHHQQAGVVVAEE